MGGSLDAYEAQDRKIIEPAGDDLDHFQTKWLKFGGAFL